MKLLLIDASGNFLDFAIRCMAHGHDVRLFIGPNKDGSRSKVGDGIVDKVQDWRPSMKWADLIVISDNAKYLSALEPFRKQGYPIFNGHLPVTEWEMNRGTGIEIFEKSGIKCIQSEVFNNYDKAIAFVEKNADKRYVSKPSGDADKALSYVSKSAADMVFMLEKWKKDNKIKSPFLLQEFVPGIEMAVSGWFGRNGFCDYFLENFEFKKLMNKDYGPNCYSPDSEVLTKDGWKFWPDVTADDEVCTLIDGEIKFEKPSSMTIGDFDGEMIGWQSPYVDILVTPGHNMYIQDDHARKEFWFEPAYETESHNRNILRGSGKWVGEDDYSQLPAFYKGGFKEWCALIGAYIADGNSKTRSVVFGNIPEHKQIIFTQIALDAGYDAKMYGKDLYINSKQLSDYCRGLGKAINKVTPEYVKMATIESIQSFLYGYGSGDGSTRENNLTYTTISKVLADDLQELCLKAGWCANIKVRNRVGESHLINGVECINRHIAYDIGVSISKNKAELNKNSVYRIPYTGKVYCCTVTSHIIYVRRNGKSCFLGQTGEQGTIMKYVKESKLAEQVLIPLQGELFRQEYCGFIDVSVIIDKKGNAWPLEHTVGRFGWPLFQIQQVLHPEPCEWMLGLIDGDYSFEPTDEIAAGVVVCMPPYPYGNPSGENEGYPVWGITDKNRFNIHPAEMMMSKSPVPVMNKDKVSRETMMVSAGNYLMVCTGTGEFVQESTDNAYDLIKELEIPNSPIVRTDIGDRLEKQIPELQKLGYAMDWEY